MKKTNTLLVGLLIASINLFAQETFDWKIAIKAIEENVTITSANCALTSDQENNLIAVGVLEGSFDFDPSEESELILDQNSSDYSFAAKYTSDGAFVWAKILAVGETYSVYVTDVQTDANNNIFTCGYFEGEVDFDPSENTFTLDASQGEVAFIQKLDKDGNFVWAKKVGTPLESSTRIQPNAMKVTTKGIFLAGQFEQKVQFIEGDESSSYNPTSDYWDIFAIKLSLDGTPEWAYAVGADGHDIAKAIDVDSKGDLYVTGTFQETIDFSPGANVDRLTAEGTDIFIIKIQDELNFIDERIINFAQRYGNGLADVGGIQVVNDTHVYFTGMYSNYFTFVSGEDNLDAPARFDNFTACYIPYIYGNEPPYGPQWAVQHDIFAYDEDGYPASKAIAVKNNKIYTTGTKKDENGINFNIRAIADGQLIDQPIVSAKYFVDPESWATGLDLCLDNAGAVYNLAAFNKYIYFSTDEEFITSDSAMSQALILFKYSDENMTNNNTDLINTVLEKAFVYPNPANNTISVKNQNDISKIEIYNLQGTVVKEINANITENIQINELENGVYFITIYQKDKRYQVARFVKQ